jgi:hypothetical protein
MLGTFLHFLRNSSRPGGFPALLTLYLSAGFDKDLRFLATIRRYHRSTVNNPPAKAGGFKLTMRNNGTVAKSGTIALTGFTDRSTRNYAGRVGGARTTPVFTRLKRIPIAAGGFSGTGGGGASRGGQLMQYNEGTTRPTPRSLFRRRLKATVPEA